MDSGKRISAALAVLSVVGAVVYTVWSTITEQHIAGWLIRMQAWGDDGRYGGNYSWVMTLLILIGGIGAILATVALVRAALIGRRAPRAVRPAARTHRLEIGVPALITFGVSASLTAFLLIEGRSAAESLGWATKLVLFAVPVAPISWVVLAEALAPAGWRQGHVTKRTEMSHGKGEPVRTIEVDGSSYTVSAEDFARAPEGTLVGILHTGGLFGQVIEVHTDLSEIGGPPTAF